MEGREGREGGEGGREGREGGEGGEGGRLKEVYEGEINRGGIYIPMECLPKDTL